LRAGIEFYPLFLFAAGTAGEALTVGCEKDTFDYIQQKKCKPKDQSK
uniref:Uncharacterized protein n=1 Tax=Apteryx owenii TaxID=8824 RepID=A0A8B9PBM0_APTOW